MDENSSFTCTKKPPHPCDIQVENINIENGEIEKIKIQNAVKAAYNIVCTGPQKQGQKTKITCTGSEPENTYWTAPKGPVSKGHFWSVLAGFGRFLAGYVDFWSFLARSWSFLAGSDLF